MLIFAPCSSKKAVPVPKHLDAASLRAAKLNTFATKWVARVRSESATHLPSKIYCGNGINAASKASQMLGAEMHIISAGMSIVRPNSLIPAYNLTVGDVGPNPLRLVTERRTSQDWWMSLNQAFGYKTPLSRVMNEYDGLVILALPESYLQMIERDLLALTPTNQTRLRIITSEYAQLPAILEAQAMRFDQRLNVLPQAPHGANASFVQRALLFFAQLQLENPRVRSVVTQRKLAMNALSAAKLKALPTRQRMSDKCIEKIIRSRLLENSWTPTRLLFELRTNEGIACEQKRFARIYEQASTGL